MISGESDISSKNRVYLLGLLAAALASGLLYLMAFVWKANLYEYYHIIHLDGRYIPTGNFEAAMRLVLLFMVLGALYAAGWWFARHVQGKSAWAIVLVGSLVFPIILLFLAPYDANDIYDNISHGRILGIYQDNPFKKVSADYPSDPFTPYVSWPTSPSAYGPLWENLAGRAAILAGDGIVQNVVAFKLLPGVFQLASLALIILILRQKAPQQALVGALLFGWNPVVLYETWGNGHNDMAMVFWIVLAVWAVINRHYTIAMLALFDGALVKFIPALLLPAAGLIALREIQGTRPRIKFVIITGILAVVLIALAYAPFWDGFSTLSINRRLHMFTASLPAVIYQVLIPKIGATKAASIVGQGAMGLMIVFALWMGIQAMRDKSWDSFPRAASIVLIFYLLIACLWFQAWYSLWVVALAPLVQNLFVRRLSILFAFSSIGKGLIMGPLLYWPRNRIPEPWFDFWFALGVLGLPWLYAVFSILKTRKPGVLQVAETIETT